MNLQVTLTAKEQTDLEARLSVDKKGRLISYHSGRGREMRGDVNSRSFTPIGSPANRIADARRALEAEILERLSTLTKYVRSNEHYFGEVGVPKVAFEKTRAAFCACAKSGSPRVAGAIIRERASLKFKAECADKPAAGS